MGDKIYFNNADKIRKRQLERLGVELNEQEWEDLRSAGEEIARMNPHRGVMSMYGLGETKFKNLKHSSPAADPFIEKYGYVPKELHHQKCQWNRLRKPTRRLRSNQALRLSYLR